MDCVRNDIKDKEVNDSLTVEGTKLLEPADTK